MAYDAPARQWLDVRRANPRKSNNLARQEVQAETFAGRSPKPDHARRSHVPYGTWRRGWDSDPLQRLNARKLLIPQRRRNGRNDTNAELRYTADTRMDQDEPANSDESFIQPDKQFFPVQ